MAQHLQKNFHRQIQLQIIQLRYGKINSRPEIALNQYSVEVVAIQVISGLLLSPTNTFRTMQRDRVPTAILLALLLAVEVGVTITLTPRMLAVLYQQGVPDLGPAFHTFQWVGVLLVSVLLLLIFLVVQAGMLLLTDLFVTGRLSFAKAFAVSVLARFPKALESLLTVLVVVGGNLNPLQVRFDPSILLPGDGWLHDVLLPYLNPFSLWSAVLLGLGLAVVAQHRSRLPAILVGGLSLLLHGWLYQLAAGA